MLQVSKISSQLGLESKIVDWYRDATFVPCGQFLIDFSPRPDHRVRYCTNTDTNPSNCFIADRLKRSRLLDDEHTRSLESPNVPIIFPQMQKILPSVWLERVYQFLLRLYSKSSQRKPAQQKKRHRVTKFRYNVLFFSPKRITWKQKKRGSVIRKRVTTHKKHYSSRR